MRSPERVIQKIQIATLGKLLNKSEITRLQKDGDDSLKSLALVLEAVMQKQNLPEEEAWFDRIESLRNNQNKLTDEISITDYGAGSPDSTLSAAEMYQGKVSVRTVGDVSKGVSKPQKWYILLFKLVREFKPGLCLELGTALGISGAYQAAACDLNNQGKLITMEGSESYVAIARANFKKLGLNDVEVVPGRFLDTLEETLNKNHLLDYVFIDGHHDENATITYYHQILPHLADGAILVFDDIYWSPGMERAWNTIKKDRNLKVSVDLFSVGICVFTKTLVKEQQCYKVAF